ncbi:EAL domain-containing protein [Rhodoferax sp.]|uniref:bifunctional diguanylate cyclase/phosphodiesterase n=1 Tax=Rhodoferax sp. TaxID=50421 RepID=UPI0025D8F8BD|nr:EAL domain-containing protein [Rhodoferax sp.]
MDPHIPHWHSLKTRLTLFMLAVFVLSIWALSLFTSRLLQEDMERLLGEQQFSTVSFVAAQVGEELVERFDALDQIAKQAGADLTRSAPAMQTLLEQRPMLQNLFNAGTLIVGPDGNTIASVPVASGRVGVNYLDRDHIAEALKEGKRAIGKPVIGKQLQAPVFGMAVPIRNAQGQVIGAMSGVIDLSKPNFLDKITRSNFGRTGGFLIIDPRYRLIVTATDKKRIMEVLPAPGVNRFVDRNIAGYEGSSVLINALGEQQFASVKQITEAGWYALLGTPTPEAFAPIHNMQQRLLLATLLLTLLAGGLTWWLLRRELSPLMATVAAMATLAKARRIPTPLPVTTRNEIGQLTGSFNRLIETWTQREDALVKSEQNLAITLNSIGDAVMAIDQAGRVSSMNPAAERLTGWSLAEAMRRPLAEVFHIVQADTREALPDPVQWVMTRDEELALADHTLLLAKDAQEYRIAGSAAPMRNAAGDGVGVVLVFSDITERHLAQVALKASEQRYRALLDNLCSGVVVHRPDTSIELFNPVAAALLGLSHDQLMGRTALSPDWCFLQDNGTLMPLEDYPVNRVVASGEPLRNQVVGVRHTNFNDPTWVLCNAYPMRDEGGELCHVVVTFLDITERRRYEHQLLQIAHFDALTHLPNRVLLADRMQQAMVQALRRKQQLAVVYLDLDGFKAINDRHTHATGDRVLVILAQRMSQCLREGDSLARLGGDEFVAVLIDLEDPLAIQPMLSRLLLACATPIQVGDLHLQVSASLGVTFYPQSQEIDADQLLRQADQAMYLAKLAGKNQYQFFDAEQDSSIRGHHENAERIRLALAQREFVLHYQPKVNMRTGQVIGTEALIRWQHLDKGLLAPAMFLPVIEEHPLAVSVGDWVIDTALTQIERWQRAGLDMAVSVNVSAYQLQQADFVERLQSILAAHPRVKPSSLELEVLETTALNDIAQVSRVIEDCARFGVMFALDDFGTGYSSLTYLKRLRIETLKIDQSFVRDMLEDPDDLAILEGIISLAAAFRCNVIAEGVETIEHGTLLLQLGCELAQGYGIARPMPAELMPGWAAAWQPDAAWSEQARRDEL